MTRYDIPIGTMTNDKLAHILESLAMTGGCDLRTLTIVAHACGLRNLFCNSRSLIVVESADKLLAAPNGEEE